MRNMAIYMLQQLGLAPTDRDKRLRKLLSKSYRSTRVVGRGTVKTDAREVQDSPEFREAQEKAKTTVGKSNTLAITKIGRVF